MGAPPGNPPDGQTPLKGQSRPKKIAPLRPPRWWMVLAVVCLALSIWLQRPGIFDHQLGNIFTWALTLLACSTLSFWFVFRSGYSLLLRILYPAAAMIGVALFLTFFRIEQVTGEMTPIFTYRFAQRPDEQLPPPQNSGDSIDLQTTGPDDFPQFLGPRRDAVYRAVSLERDWAAHPPEERWRVPIGAGWSGFAAVNGYGVTLEQRRDQEYVTCYDLASGELLWSHSHAAQHNTVLGGLGPRSTPTIDEGRVYAHGATGVFVCLDGATGELLWEKNLPVAFGASVESDVKNIAWGRAGSPLIVDHLVIVPAGGPGGAPGGGRNISLVAYDKKTGREVWRGGNRQVSYSSPALATLAGVRQVLSVNEDNVSSHDIKTGAVLWQHPWPGSSAANASVSQPVAVNAQSVLLSKGYGGGAELLGITRSEKDGAWSVTSRWKEPRLLKTKFCNVALLEGRYAFGLSDGILECIDLKEGRRLWKKGRFGHGQILRVGDVLLVQTESGDIAMVDASPEKFRVLGEIKVFQSKCWNTLCLYGSRLLVRNDREAVCLELPLAPNSPGS